MSFKHSFAYIVHYLEKIFPSTAKVCKPLRQMTSMKTEWILNASYQKLFNREKAVIREDACIRFCDETRPLYLGGNPQEGYSHSVTETLLHTTESIAVLS